MVINTMLFSLIRILLMVSLCDGYSFLCQSFDERTKSLEMYGERYKGIVPFEHCAEDIGPVDPSQVKQLKIGGCDCDKFAIVIEKLKYVRSLDISYSYGYESLDWLNLRLEWLKKFNASHIDLSTIPKRFFTKTPRIIEIDFSHNKLRRIDANAFTGADKLVNINLSHNNIWIIRSGAFDRLPDLEHVDLRSNSLTRLGSFNANQKLKVVHAEENPITEFICLRSVSLYMSWRNIQTLHGHGLMKLEVVRNSSFEAALLASYGKHEIHCTEGSFDNLNHFVAGRSKFENVTEILQCLGSHVTVLNLSGNFIGSLRANALQKFENLEELSLSGTAITFFDFEMVKSHNLLHKLDISFNNLRHVNNIVQLESLNSLRIFNSAGNELERAPELIKHLRPSIEFLDLSGSFIGRLNITTFSHLTALKTLKLSNATLSFPDINPFESLRGLSYLDISYISLKGVNFSTLSTTLSNLNNFNAGHCDIESIPKLVQHLGSTIKALDLSGNIIGALNVRTFASLNNLEYLNLSNSDLSIGESNPFEELRSLRVLDISHNTLGIRDFTKISTILNQLVVLRAASCHIQNISNPNELHLSTNNSREINTRSTLHSLSVLDLHGNDLTNIDNLFQKHPNIQYIGIAKNWFSCAYLKQLMHKWTHLRFSDDPWDQKNSENCQHTMG